MSTKIRLTRGGAKKKPYYRIIVTDSRNARDGRFIEKVGSYNPMLAKNDPNRVILDEERIRYWLGTGAQTSERVAFFLRNAGIIKAEANAAKKAPKAPRKKAEA